MRVALKPREKSKATSDKQWNSTVKKQSFLRQSELFSLHFNQVGGHSITQRQSDFDQLAAQNGNRSLLRQLSQPQGLHKPCSVQRAADDSESTLLQQSMAKGVRNEVRLTDILFFARHPERNGRLIEPRSEPDLVQEWLTIRNTLVRPTLASGGSAAADSRPVVKQEPAVPAITQPTEAAAQGVPVAETPTSTPQKPEEATQQPTEDLTGGGQNDKLRQLDEIVASLQQMQVEVDSATVGAGGVNAAMFFRQLNETSGLAHYQEAAISRTQMMAGLLRTARDLVNSLTASELGTEASNLERVKGHYHRLLNGFTPYFTQMANRNWLFTADMRAWERTCNLTSLAMTLEAMGVQPKDFLGDADLLTQIAQRFESRFASFEDVADLRMPDFLQLVMIYVKFDQAGGNGFEQKVDQARRLAASVIAATLDIFAQVTSQFGVAEVNRGFVRSQAQLDYDRQAGSASFEGYRQGVLQQLSPWLDRGGQVVANLPGHYVRLENIESNGIVIDDPAYAGKNYKLTWQKTYREGYFRSYLVFMKK